MVGCPAEDWTTKIFHIIDNVEINDSRASDGQGGLFPSRIVWNEVVFDSFQAGFLRNIDFQLCMRLEHPTALRMYRFLGKRFYHQAGLDVRPQGIRLRAYRPGPQLRRRHPDRPQASARHRRAGRRRLPNPLPENERFTKKGRDWSIRLIQQSPALSSADTLSVPEAAIPPLVSELIKRDVHAETAAELVQDHPAEAIQIKLEVFDWLMEKQDKRAAKNPPGYLIASIQKNYPTPKGFIPKAERVARAEAKRQADQKSAEERRHKQEQDSRDQARQRKADAYIKQLDQAERIALESEALAAASPESERDYERPDMARFRPTLMLTMLRDYVADQLEREHSPVEA